MSDTIQLTSVIFILLYCLKFCTYSECLSFSLLYFLNVIILHNKNRMSSHFKTTFYIIYDTQFSILFSIYNTLLVISSKITKKFYNYFVYRNVVLQFCEWFWLNFVQNIWCSCMIYIIHYRHTEKKNIIS